MKDIASVNERSIKKGDRIDTIQYIDIAAVNHRNIDKLQVFNLNDAPSRARRIVKDNDILISTVRPNLKHYTMIRKAEPNMVASTGFAVISPKKVYPDFLYYYLTSDSYTRYLTQIAEGQTSAYPAFNPDIIENTVVYLPPENEQFEIGEMLASLDKKIELNNAINKNLEEMAQTLFKRWFVEFEFPNENGEPYKSSGGEFEECELGLIPKGWKVGRATDIFDVQSGGTPKTSTSEYWNGEIPFFTPKDCSNFFYVINTEKTITEDGLNNCNSKLYKTDTVFITARGTVGKVALAGRDMAMNQSCYALVAKNGYTQKYVFHQTQQLINVLRKNASGAVFDAITVSTFQNLKTILPDTELIRKFDGLVNELYSLMLEKINEIQNLQHIRDTLLPKLMSGEIRVPVEKGNSVPDLPMVAESSAIYQP